MKYGLNSLIRTLITRSLALQPYGLTYMELKLSNPVLEKHAKKLGIDGFKFKEKNKESLYILKIGIKPKMLMFAST